jgi:hypothetical protein
LKLPVIWEQTRKLVDLDELFSDEFTHLQAVTYVATPAFFFKYTQKYEKVELILGIDNPNQQHRVHRYFLDAKKITTDWEQLSKEIRNRIQSEQYSIRNPKPEYIVHSKIFLLSNPKTNKKRVIVGSANFTQQAFNPKKQFEEILVFENETMFTLNQARVNEIREHTLDYIPEVLKKKPQGEEVTLVMIDQKELVLQVLEERAQQGKTAGIIISEEIYQQLEQESREAKESIDIINQSTRIIEVITQKKHNSSDRSIITPKQLEQKKGKLKTIVTPKYEKIEDKDVRPNWYMDRKNYYIYSKEEDEQEAKLLSSHTSLDEIKKNISALENYIRSYEEFSILHH